MGTRTNETADRELFIERTLNAPVDIVWDAWSTPEHIANWWGPNGFTNTITRMDLQTGGEWELTMHGPDGTDYKNKSRFIEVIVNKRIVYEHSSPPKFVSTIEFEDRGEQTHLTWHMLFETRELFIAVVKAHGADEGLKQNVAKLEVYLKGMI